MVEVRSVANFDSNLSGYHDSDEPYGLLIPVLQTAAVSYRWDDFIGDAGVRTFALYGKHLSGIRRPIYTVTAMLSLYLNVFVLVVQAFLKLPPLKAWAPTQTEPAFLVAQGSAFLLFFALTILTTVKFRPVRLAAY
jgi:hypothetical protein